MIRINLLPPEFAEAQSKKEQQILFGGAGALVLILLLGFWGIKKNQAANLRSKIREADAELKKFTAINSQIENIEKSKKRLIAKKNVITGLNRSRLTYPVLFEDMLPIIPSDVWVKSVTLQEKGSSIDAQVSANALSNFALATWLTNLEQSKHFSNIVLGNISYKSTNEGPSVLSFKISLSYSHKGPLPLEAL